MISYLFSRDNRTLIKALLYFLGIFLGTRYSSTVNWLIVLGVPLLFWGKNINRWHRLDGDIKKMLTYYLIFACLIVVTAVFSPYSIQYPLTRFVTIVAIALTVSLIFSGVQQSTTMIKIFDGIVIAVIILSIYLFANYFNGYVLILDLDEQNWGNRNTAGNFFLLGFFASVLRACQSKNNRYFWIISTYFLICVWLSTSMKCMVTSLAVYFYCVFKLRKSMTVFGKVVLICAIVAVVSFVAKNLQNILESSPNAQMAVDRLYTLFGYDSYATQHYGFIELRERLIRQTIALFYENPFLGVGLENSRWIYGTYSHNTYVEILAGGGIVLIIPFLLFLYSSVRPLLFKKNYVLLLIWLCIIYISNANRIYDAINHIFILFSIVCVHKMDTETEGRRLAGTAVS